MFQRNNVKLQLALTTFSISLLSVKETIPKYEGINSITNLIKAVNASVSNQGTDPKKSSKKLALLVGINNYKNPRIPNLPGCVNEVENMRALLIGKFEFPNENILVLSDTSATHSAIVKAFQSHLIAQAKHNDIIVFYFSGHGSKMKDRSVDEIDNLDETIVPHDSRDPGGKVFDTSDDEINGLLDLLSEKTKNITFSFDSCHSGTAVRGSELARTIAVNDRQAPPS